MGFIFVIFHKLKYNVNIRLLRYYAEFLSILI